jgi:hypothetical protein
MAERTLPENLTPNSETYKQHRRELEQRSKERDAKKERAFFKESAQDVGRFIVWDVLIPAFKDLISDIVKKGIDAFLFGEESANRSQDKKKLDNPSYIQYGNYSKYRDRDRRNDRNRHGDQWFIRGHGKQVEDPWFASESKALDVRDQMVEIIARYDMAFVADLYDIMDEPALHTDYKFGWYEFGDATVRRVRDGFVIDLPRVREMEE